MIETGFASEGAMNTRTGFSGFASEGAGKTRTGFSGFAGEGAGKTRTGFAGEGAGKTRTGFSGFAGEGAGKTPTGFSGSERVHAYGLFFSLEIGRQRASVFAAAASCPQASDCAGSAVGRLVWRRGDGGGVRARLSESAPSQREVPRNCGWVWLWSFENELICFNNFIQRSRCGHDYDY